MNPIVGAKRSQTRKTKKDILVLFDEYIHECRFARRRSSETIRGYKQVFSILMKLCPTLTVETLSPKMLTNFFDILQTRERVVGRGSIKKGVRDSTVATYCSKLHSFFEWLVAKGHLDKNPLHNIKRVRPTYDDIKSLRKEQVDKIRAAIETGSNSLLQLKRDKVMLSLLLFCGLRRGELFGLQVTDIDLENQTLVVRQETSKSKRSRVLPINAQLSLHLEDYLSERKKRELYTTPSLIVSLDRDRGLSKDGLKHWVERLKGLSGVRFHLHRFRHTFACNVAMKSANAIQLQALLGHTDLRMTQTYVRSLTAEDLRPVTDSLTFDGLT